MPPIAEQLSLPSSYGAPDRLLDWPSVEQRLVDSPRYWLATVRRDGSPHVIPVDGIWLDGGCCFGGDPATVHIRNLRRDGRATLHLEDGESAVIVEGIAEWTTPSKTVAQRLAKASTAKYGYSQSAASYLAGGMATAASQGSGLDHAIRRCDPLPFRGSGLKGFMSPLSRGREERFPETWFRSIRRNQGRRVAETSQMRHQWLPRHPSSAQ
jgi:hypothetical protein